MALGVEVFCRRMMAGGTWRRSLQDPLLVAAVVVLGVAWAGIILTMALAWGARWLEVPVGGDINGFTISVDVGGGNALGFALVLFVLARVFRHGNRLQDDVEGTV